MVFDPATGTAKLLVCATCQITPTFKALSSLYVHICFDVRKLIARAHRYQVEFVDGTFEFVLGSSALRKSFDLTSCLPNFTSNENDENSIGAFRNRVFD